MSNLGNDQHLENLRKASVQDATETQPPPPNTGRRTNQRRKPNTRGLRVSARRIGGPDYGQQFQEKIRQKQLEQATTLVQKKSIGSNSGRDSTPTKGLLPVNLGASRTVANNSGSLINPIFPKVQELGVRGRRSSSRMGLSLASRGRSNSSTSNHSINDKITEPKEAIIRYGELLKKGVLTQQWKRRFFVLTDRHLLYYLDSFDVPQELQQIDLAPRGQIEISVIDEIRKDKNDKSGASFNLYTAARVYRMKIEASDDSTASRIASDAWIASISGARENAKQQHLGPTSRGSFSSYKVDEVDAANQSAITFKHPVKSLIDQERYTNKGPHKPANLEEYQDWTPFDVAAWLYTIHLQKYSEEFYKQGVDGQRLKGIRKDEDAAGLGVEEEDIQEFLLGVRSLKQVNDIVDSF